MAKQSSGASCCCTLPAQGVFSIRKKRRKERKAKFVLPENEAKTFIMWIKS
jgi:hypothetical protein